MTLDVQRTNGYDVGAYAFRGNLTQNINGCKYLDEIC